MNKDFTYYLCIFIVVCILSYIVFRSLNFKEGMETETSSISLSNGLAGGAAGYAANLKAEVIKLQDTILISKYRKEYENVVINMDDLVNNLMLQTTLKIDQSKPQEGLAKLVILNNAKQSLNNVMKFIDSK